MLFASFMKLAIISIIMKPIGNAIIIATDCKFRIEFSENINAIGNIINIIDQNILTIFAGSISTVNVLYE